MGETHHSNLPDFVDLSEAGCLVVVPVKRSSAGQIRTSQRTGLCLIITIVLFKDADILALI
jgi:hypothetical protein